MEVYPKYAYAAVKRAIKATRSKDIGKICLNLEEQAKRKNKRSPETHMNEAWEIYTTNDVKAILSEIAAKEMAK